VRTLLDWHISKMILIWEKQHDGFVSSSTVMCHQGEYLSSKGAVGVIVLANAVQSQSAYSY